MARIKLIQNKEDVAPEHAALFDQVAALRGRVSGPSSVVMHSPRLAQPWNEVSEYLHRQSIVKPRHAELAVCATARHYDCSYIWNAHLPLARQAGVSESTLSQVRDHTALYDFALGETVIVWYVRTLLQNNRVPEGVTMPLITAEGERWLVELTVWIGRYAALAGILNAFDVSPPPDAELLPDLAAAPFRQAPSWPAARPLVRQLTERESVAEADRPVFDAVAEGRGSVRGPFSLLMHSPQLCRSIFDVSNALRFDSELSPRLRELATIATAREKDCAYVWAAHAPAARKEGVEDQTIALVRDRGDASSLPPSDRDVIDFTRQLLVEHRVGPELFDRLLAEHGVTRLVELTALIGHYNMITTLLNAAEVAPAPEAERLTLA